MLLQALVAPVEDFSRHSHWNLGSRIIPQLGQPVANGVPLRQLAQVGERDCVLGLDPALGCGTVQVLHPAIWIGDGTAEVVVGDILPVAWRVGDLLGMGRGRRCQQQDQSSEAPHRVNPFRLKPDGTERAPRSEAGIPREAARATWAPRGSVADRARSRSSAPPRRTSTCSRRRRFPRGPAGQLSIRSLKPTPTAAQNFWRAPLGSRSTSSASSTGGDRSQAFADQPENFHLLRQAGVPKRRRSHFRGERHQHFCRVPDQEGVGQAQDPIPRRCGR